VHLITDSEHSLASARNLNSTQLPGGLTLSRLTAGYEGEVLDFLSRRPSHTFGLTGFVRDNGLASPRNRGKFYACRDRRGALAGVALIGHAVLFETTCDAAIEVFARLARSCKDAFLSLSEQDKSQLFCRHYSRAGAEPKLIRRELLLELQNAGERLEAVPDLIKATLDDIDLVVNAHAELAAQQRGSDPLESDAAGFRQRCIYRIEKGRTWVWRDEQGLIFKADVVSATPEVNYLEGIWVNRAQRSRGYGLRCLSQLSNTLLQQTRSICLLALQNNEAGHRFYQKAGYRQIGLYETVYL
jgi:GNAT superfamily N-acetyltransferase